MSSKGRELVFPRSIQELRITEVVYPKDGELKSHIEVICGWHISIPRSFFAQYVKYFNKLSHQGFNVTADGIIYLQHEGARIQISEYEYKEIAAFTKELYPEAI